MKDVIIIGGGAAGLTAAMYLGRYGMQSVLFEKMFVGGQASTTYEIDNYMGFDERISGPDLMMKMESHAVKFGADIRYDEILNVELSGEVKRVTTAKEIFEAKAVILAMGAVARPLGVQREEEMRGKGVSYCATCDGAFYKGLNTAVVGGGDTALEDAIFLSKGCNKVYLIHRRDQFRGNKMLQDKVKSLKNVELVLNSQVTGIVGEQKLTQIEVNRNGEQIRIPVSGLFIAVGIMPTSEMVKDLVETDKNGYIITDETMATNIPGVFAAGDVVKKPLRQIITAASDGAVAAFSATKFVELGR